MPGSRPGEGAAEQPPKPAARAVLLETPGGTGLRKRGAPGCSQGQRALLAPAHSAAPAPPSPAAATAPPAAQLREIFYPAFILPIFVQKNNPTALFQAARAARGADEGNHPCEEFVRPASADLPCAAIALQPFSAERDEASAIATSCFG